MKKIGIKLNDKKVVPMNLCFRFVGNDEYGLEELSKWSEINKIKILKKNFKRWI